MVLVYGTTWVGETYYRQSAQTAQEMNESDDPVGDIARKGSLAFVLFSVISFGSSVILPWIVQPPSETGKPSTTFLSQSVSPIRCLLDKYQIDIVTAWAMSQLAFGGCMIVAPISTSFNFSTTVIALCGMQVHPCLHSLTCADGDPERGPCTAGLHSRSSVPRSLEWRQVSRMKAGD